MSIPPEKLTNRDRGIATGDRSDLVKPLGELQAVDRIEPAYPHVGAAGVSISAHRQPLRLIYRASINQLSASLGAAAEAGGGELAGEVDLDPQTAASQILQFVNGHYEKYRNNHPELTNQQQLDRYLPEVEAAILRGFEEARGILRALKIPEEQISSSIDRTTDLIRQGLAALRAARSGEHIA